MAPAQAGTALTVDACFALLTVDDAAARPAFEACCRAAEAGGDGGDGSVALLCAAGMVLAIAVEYADFRGLEHWSRRLCAGLLQPVPFNSALARSRFDAAVVALPWLVTLPADTVALARASAVRLFDAIAHSPADEAPIPADERMMMAKMLVDFHAQQNDPLNLERVAVALQDHLRSGGVSPVWRARWWLLLQSNHAYFGQPVAARTARERVQALIDRHGLPQVQFELACLELTDAVLGGDLTQADRLYDDIDLLRPEVRPGRVPHGLRPQALLLICRGRYGEALHKTDLLLALCADAQVPRRDRGVYFVMRAHVLAALGRSAEALATLDAEREHQHGAAANVLQAITHMLVAVQALQAGDADRNARVAEAMRSCAATGFDRFLNLLPVWAGRIAEMALDAGIETDFVRSAIRLRRLLPADPMREDWPWRLRVYALGELRLLRDGEPVHTAGKAQRKPLELLALLAAHGGGPVAIDTVIDQLWPSLEANAPRASFDMALSRLRKLLDVPDALPVAEGSVALHPALVWTDVAAFERLWERLAGPTPTAAGADADAVADRALALYRDRLLGSEDAAGWLQAPRERLALKFARVVAERGARLEQQGQWRAATALYERGLTRDTLAEPIYRALMRAHLELGERAEALRTFRRCRQLLLAVLGTEPSAQTQALARAAADNG